MGRKLNVSTPTVINTELVPLSESFYIEADGNLEQWYYENDDRYAPNRKVTPMTLTPCISAFDADTQQTYTPSFYTVRWFEQAWDSTQGAYVETEITNTVDSLSADYVKVGDTLLVKKNVGYTHSVTITCKAQYIDPRDSGITYNISDSVLLTTNRDATVVTPELDVDCPSSQAFNPLVDNEIVNGNLQYKSEFTMKASSDYSSVLATNVAQYKVDPLGTEEVIPTNETAVVTSAPTMDIRYGDYEQTNQKFMRRQTSGGQVPYIAGNMAYVNKIKGNTVKFNQLTKNGDFSYGTANWSSFSTTTSVSNNTLSYSAKIKYGRLEQHNVPIKKDHKYYICGDFDLSRKTSDFQASKFYLLAFYYSTSPNFEGLFANEAAGVLDRMTHVGMIISARDNSEEIEICRYTGDNNLSSEFIVYVRNVMLIDLTDLGIANLTTVAEVEAWLAANIGLKSYYPYNAGELIPVKMSAIKSSGFNIFDEQFERGIISSNGTVDKTQPSRITSSFIPVVPNASYYFKIGNQTSNGQIAYYDKDKNFLSVSGSWAPNAVYTMPANAYFVRFNPTYLYGVNYNHDICVNISDPSRNGTYEAHWEAEQFLPITELKGKVNGTGDSVVIFPNGMNHVGDVYDEIKVEDGVIKAIKRFEYMNIGSQTITRASYNGIYAFIVVDTGKANGGNLISNKYAVSPANAVVNMADKTILSSNNTYLYIRDDSCDTESAFEQANQDTYVVFELSNPVEYIIDNMPRGQFEWYGINNNAEVLVETLPWYKSGQHTDTLVVDAMYGEEIRVVLRSRVSAGSDRLYPNKVYRSIVWKIPDVDITAYSENGGAVRSDTVSMGFGTVMNVCGSALSDQIKEDNIRLNWKVRKSNSENETDFGWGQKKTIAASDLRNVIGSSSSLASTLVLPYGYLLGANEPVTDSNDVVTDNDETVYDRPVF